MMLTDSGQAAAVDAITAIIDSGRRVGVLTIFDSEDRRLVELNFGTTAFQPWKDGQAVANKIKPAIIENSGKPVAFSAANSDGRVAFVGTCGSSNADLIFDRDFVAGGECVIEDWAIRFPTRAKQ